MKNKIFLIAIALIALICCSAVSADDDASTMGNIISSNFTATEDGDFFSNLFGGGDKNVTFNATVTINTTDIENDDARFSEFFQNWWYNDATCDLTISDGTNQYVLTGMDCEDMFMDVGNLTIHCNDVHRTIEGVPIDVNNCEITHCSIHFDDGGTVKTYEAE